MVMMMMAGVVSRFGLQRHARECQFRSTVLRRVRSSVRMLVRRLRHQIAHGQMIATARTMQRRCAHSVEEGTAREEQWSGPITVALGTTLPAPLLSASPPSSLLTRLQHAGKWRLNGRLTVRLKLGRAPALRFVQRRECCRREESVQSDGTDRSRCHRYRHCRHRHRRHR